MNKLEIMKSKGMDVVFVVRCKNCKHSESLDRTKPPFKYYKDGLEINETEFGISPGLYHIEILNKGDFNNADFYSIDYKFICLC
jgi:hypothetical protein